MLGNFRADSLSMQKTRKKANEFSDANQIKKKKSFMEFRFKQNILATLRRFSNMYNRLTNTVESTDSHYLYWITRKSEFMDVSYVVIRGYDVSLARNGFHGDRYSGSFKTSKFLVEINALCNLYCFVARLGVV